RGNRRDLRGERAHQGAPRGGGDRAARHRRRLGSGGRRARRPPGRAFRALRRPGSAGSRQRGEAARRARRRRAGAPRRPLPLRRGVPARAVRPGAAARRGALGGAHHRGAARGGRFRLRPGLPRSRPRPDCRRDVRRGQERGEPPRAGFPQPRGAAARARRAPGRAASAGLPPLSPYVHLPWCVSKCPYCDFNSHVAGPRMDRERYVRALLADLAEEAPRLGGRPVVSVFLGGGTPSLFAPHEIEKLLSGVHARLRLVPDVEITMEANPGTVERGRLADYRAAGVNRLSLGVQSFDDAMLARLGRIHDAADVLAAWREAEAARFDAVNLDLMYALPGQDAHAAAADLRHALALAPAHLSWYELTLEPN